MELIKISPTKLKIMLTPEDMREYEIDCESVDYARTETRRAFWSILDEAKHRTGFDAASERVYIQLYPSREGGCEMYVTKVGLIAAPDGSTGPGMLRVAPERRLAYSFDGLDTLLRACRQLRDSADAQNSAAFFDADGKCYLCFTGVRGFCIPDSFGVLGVSAVEYLPYAFLPIICPVMAIICAITGLGVYDVDGNMLKGKTGRKVE